MSIPDPFAGPDPFTASVPWRELAVSFRAPMPPEIERIWRDVFPRVLPFMPPGLREIVLAFDPSDLDHGASVGLRANYRACTIELCPSILGMAPRDRLQTVLHEIAHVWAADSRTAVLESLAALAPRDTREYKIARERIEFEDERLVEDLSHHFLAVLEGRVGATP